MLDASAGIEIVLHREKSGLLKDIIEKATLVVTSELYKSEVANVLWKYNMANLLTKEQTFSSLSLCNNLIDEYVNISENQEESLNESIRMVHPVYDLLYFTLARRRGAVLLSMDKKLNKISKENGIEIYESFC